MGRKRDIFFAALVLLGLWAIAALLLDSMALPEPWAVLRDIGIKIADGSLLDDLFISAVRALLGIFLALAAAVPLGLAIGAEPPLRRYFSPYIYLLYPIPHAVLLPPVLRDGAAFFQVRTSPTTRPASSRPSSGPTTRSSNSGFAAARR